MANAVQNPADVINSALSRLGYKLRVGHIFDGSDAANESLDNYSQTLDAMLRDGDWGFAQREVSPVLLKSAPEGGYFDTPWTPQTYPPIPWAYTYEIPSDYLKVRSVRPAPGFLLEMDPTPTLFNVVSDNGYTPPRRVLACNVPSAVLIYTGQVTNPVQWPADFTEAFIAALARRLAPTLADLNVVKMESQEEAMTTAVAGMVQG